MYNIIGTIIEQPTTLNNKIVEYYKEIEPKLTEYTTDALNASVFGQDNQPTFNKGNDFHYLCLLLTIIYYDEQTYYNTNGVYRTQEEKYDEYNLEVKRLYFNKYHQFDIVPLYIIFDIIDGVTDDILGPDLNTVDLNNLIPEM